MNQLLTHIEQTVKLILLNYIRIATVRIALLCESVNALILISRFQWNVTYTQ